MNDHLTKRLDAAILAVLHDPATELSAEAVNALHAATSTHPWGQGKTLAQRALGAFSAVAGRAGVSADHRHRIARLSTLATREQSITDALR